MRSMFFQRGSSHQLNYIPDTLPLSVSLRVQKEHASPYGLTASEHMFLSVLPANMHLYCVQSVKMCVSIVSLLPLRKALSCYVEKSEHNSR